MNNTARTFGSLIDAAALKGESLALINRQNAIKAEAELIDRRMREIEKELKEMIASE